jgi:hypothetical protein
MNLFITHFTDRSAILTMLQIQSAGDDPITRTAALLALICAMMSLLFGCIYVARFGTMKRTHQALSWAEVCNSRACLFGQ